MVALKRLLPGLVLSCALTTAYSQLQITPESNALALAQKLVGSGVTISNVTISGSPVSMGFFKNLGGNQLNLDSGIVLSTGRVITQSPTFGLNGVQNNHASYATNMPGDDDLNGLVDPRPTNDAVILEFDFVPIGDSVKFRYVFSSEEYPSFTCTNFNDVFAFFISGPGITGMQNMALVPGTSIPVAINSINSGIPGGGGSLATCNAMGPGSPFTQYYVNNSGNQTFTHNGHTVVLTASAAVQPCQVYHLKIAIADVNDRSYDSGVFLEAESLKSDPIKIVNSLPVINGLPYLVEGCQPGGIKIIRSKKSPSPQPVNLAYTGTAVNGTDFQLMPAVATIPANDSVVFVPITPIVDNIPEGIEFVKIYVSNGCILTDFYLDSITIELREYDTLTLTPSGVVGICKNASQQLSASGGHTSYQWSPAASLSDPNIRNPIASPAATTTYICTAVLGDCHAQDSVTVQMKILEFVSKKDINCANGTTGEIRVSGGPEWKAPVQYSINNAPFGNDSTFTNLAAGSYTVRIKDGTGCMDSIQVTLVQAFPDLGLSEQITSASCVGTNGQVEMSGTGGKLPYSFAVDGGSFTTANVHTITGGSHVIKIMDANGCVATKPITVSNDPPINFVTTASPASCSGSPDGMIYISASGGSGNYSYSIDGVNFQVADSFLVNVGNLTVTVKDEKGCSASQQVNIPLNQTIFVNAGNDTTICEGNTVQFNTTANAASFSWVAHPTLSATTIPNPVASPVVTTTYYVSATKDICTAYDTITVTVLPAPVPNAGPDTSICVGKTIQLQANGGASYSWLPASLLSDPSIANPTTKPVQTTDFYVQAVSADGCPSLKYDTVRVSLVPAVQAFAGRDTSVTKGQPLQLNSLELGNSGVTSFQWSPVQGLNDPNISNPVATLDRDITYKVTMVTPEGCEGSDFINIKVFDGPEIYVPTAFTPNGDGRNDILKPIPVGIKSFKYFRVYNRWGQMIFSTNIEGRGWDGRLTGLDQSTGTYVWIAEAVDYKGNTIQRKGTFTLIR